MKHNSKRIFSAAAITAAVTFALSPALWAADNAKSGSDSSRVRVTDFSGRPPFKRGFASGQEVADLARFEETAALPADGSLRTVDFKGTPPFKRRIVSAEDVADFARFEEVTTSPKGQRTRLGPPGKATSRR